MKWVYWSNPKWMIARNGFLCASEIAPLAKSLSRSKPATLRSMGKLKARKAADVSPDPWSYSDAAKGHVCEEYAVKNFNKYSGPSMFHWNDMYHWDDVIVTNGNIGWSPDALDISMDSMSNAYGDDMVCISSDALAEFSARECLEIKSYGPEHYYECSRIEDKTKLDERWQIATAMYVCPCIKTGYLMYFSPEIHEATTFMFSREELAEELDTIAELDKMWESVDITELPSSRNVWKVDESLEEIWKEQKYE